MSIILLKNSVPSTTCYQSSPYKIMFGVFLDLFYFDLDQHNIGSHHVMLHPTATNEKMWIPSKTCTYSNNKRLCKHLNILSMRKLHCRRKSKRKALWSQINFKLITNQTICQVASRSQEEGRISCCWFPNRNAVSEGCLLMLKHDTRCDCWGKNALWMLVWKITAPL